MSGEKRTTRSVIGRLTLAGEMLVNGKRMYGFLVEACGPSVMAAGNLHLLNRQVVITQDRRVRVSGRYIRHITEQQDE